MFYSTQSRAVTKAPIYEKYTPVQPRYNKHLVLSSFHDFMDIPMDSFFVSEIEKTRHIPERIASDTFMVSFPVICTLFSKRFNQFALNNSSRRNSFIKSVIFRSTSFVIKLYLISSFALIMHSWKVLISSLKTVEVWYWINNPLLSSLLYAD